MCGRYTPHHAPAEIGKGFDVEVVPELVPVSLAVNSASAQGPDLIELVSE